MRTETREKALGRPAESYLLQATSKNSYVAGMTAVRSERFAMHVDVLKGKIEAEGINTKSEARKFLKHNWSG